MGPTRKESESNPDKRPEPRLGLALSGGAARGVAHTGVIQILVKNGIHPDLVAGCSSGAIAGAFYCAKVPFDKQLEFAQKLRWRSVRMLGIPKMGFFQPGEMERFLREVLGDIRFEDLQVPLAVMATEFRTARSVVIRDGSVARALSASAAIPVIFSPVIDGKEILVDGGLTDNLPAQVCRVMGADIVLGVNVLPEFSRKRTYHNMFDIALGTFDLLALPSTDRGGRAADLTVVPPVGNLNPSDMSRVEETVARGAAAMRRALPELRQLLDHYGEDRRAKKR
jgi:NTE family protein